MDAAGNDAIKAAVLIPPRAGRPPARGTWTDRDLRALQRDPVAQAFRTRTGAVLTVVANHLKSEGSCPAQDGPDSGIQDGQGRWNATRVAQAQALAGLVRDTVVPGAGDRDVLVVGDLNPYAREDPVVALCEEGHTDMIRTFAGTRAYSCSSTTDGGAVSITPRSRAPCGGR